MKVYVDGNPKEVCCVTEDDVVFRAPIDGTNTNNVAEYRAILFGLHMCPEATEVVSDSQLVIRQLNLEYAVKSEHLLYWWNRVVARVNKLGHSMKFVWAPRDENKAGRVLG